MTDRASRSADPRWLFFAVVVTALLLAMTLTPDSTVNTTNFTPFRQHGPALRCVLSQCPNAAGSAEFLAIDVIGNVFVFIPIGFTFAGVLSVLPGVRRFVLAVGGGVLLSLFIETVQLRILTRATDVDDLIFNTLGAAIGAVLLIGIQRVNRLRNPVGPRSRNGAEDETPVAGLTRSG